MLKVRVLAILLALGATMPLVGCEKDGPAESAGEKMDEAYENSKDSVEDAMDEAGDKMEEACDKATDDNC